MSYILVGFLIKLLDIPGAMIGLVGGWFSKSWLHVAIVALAGGSAGEIILYFTQDERKFDPVIWLVGVAACFAWAAAAFWLKSFRSRWSSTSASSASYCATSLRSSSTLARALASANRAAMPTRLDL